MTIANERLSAKEFRVHQDDWIQALILYRDEKGKALPGNTLRVGMALQLYENATTYQGLAYPTRMSLSIRAGIKGKPDTRRRELTMHLNRLTAAGLIVKVREGQRPTAANPRGVSAVWRLVVPAELQAEIDALFSHDEHEGLVGVDTHQPTGVSGSLHTSTLVGVDTHQPRGSLHTSTLGGVGTHPTHSEARSENTLGNHTPSNADDFDDPISHDEDRGTIEAFCDAYPKGISVDALQYQWAETVGGGADGQQLVTAATHYAEECERIGKEVAFRTSAAKFLRDGHWKQYLIPVAGAQPSVDEVISWNVTDDYWADCDDDEKPF